MENKRLELEKRIAELRDYLNAAERSFSKEYRGHEIIVRDLAAAERELAAMDTQENTPTCSDCLYYDAPGKCACFAEAISEADNCLTSTEWAYNFTPRKPEQEAQ